ncbi:hypothetical protein Acr_00g0034240 [Actinidia rufa]|uniref:DUF4283 domain-containing protein n=1 Tax=Actinidia rufa TaxID=165716 RepID=A0A7J0DFV8_9ERIC|nr:hypothetical protein Acr_00g0034240 [Actinidia rufa]
MLNLRFLENGPYIIYGRPLLLKTMPRFFRFENEAISSFLVWVQLRNIPLDLWSPNVLGKNCSKLGKSIHMDKLTAQKERVTYTRCLVEVNMAKDLAHTIMINLLSGQVYEHAVFYENLSRFCPHCKIVRHTENGCKVKKTNSNKAEPTKAAETVTNVEKESGPKVAETRVQESKGQPSGTETEKAQETSTGNKFSILDGIPERLTKINYSLQASNPNSKWGAKEQAAADAQSLEWRDFNNVLDSDGNANGLPVTMYEIRDFKNCCYDIGISDLRSIGGIHTSSNNSVWSKLDRAMVNNKWIRDGLIAHVNFDLPRKFSDHSPYTAQQQLHDNPEDPNLQIIVSDLRSKALKLPEAEVSYCSQFTKAKYLKNCDIGTKFFHGLIKSNRSKNHIASISLEDGSRTTSKNQVSEPFVQYYMGLLGTKRDCIRLDKEIMLKGKILEAEQASNLIRAASEEEIKSALFSIGYAVGLAIPSHVCRMDHDMQNKTGEVSSSGELSASGYPFSHSSRGDESIDHLFFQCRVGNQIWSQIKTWLGISRAMQTLKATVKWMIKEARGTGLQSKAKKISLACIVYRLWELENQRIFEGKINLQEAIIRRIQIQVYRSGGGVFDAAAVSMFWFSSKVAVVAGLFPDSFCV